MLKPVRTRRPRDPEATREAILEAASTLLAQSQPDGISLSAVAQLAGVNRGTAYQHFETRENLVEATIQWVSDRMFRSVFGDPNTIEARRIEDVDMVDVTDRLSRFAMDNPELSRIWLLQMLAAPDANEDPFWREYVGSLRRFAQTDLAREDIDVEAFAVTILSGTVMWPVWARAHTRSDAKRRALARRFTRECLRLCLYGSVNPAFYPEIKDRLENPDDELQASRTQNLSKQRISRNNNDKS